MNGWTISSREVGETAPLRRQRGVLDRWEHILPLIRLHADHRLLRAAAVVFCIANYPSLYALDGFSPTFTETTIQEKEMGRSNYHVT